MNVRLTDLLYLMVDSARLLQTHRGMSSGLSMEEITAYENPTKSKEIG